MGGGHQPSMGGPSVKYGGGSSAKYGGPSVKYGGVINQVWGAISQVWGVSIFPPVCTGSQNPQNYFSNTYVLPSVNRTAGPMNLCILFRWHCGFVHQLTISWLYHIWLYHVCVMQLPKHWTGRRKVWAKILNLPQMLTRCLMSKRVISDSEFLMILSYSGFEHLKIYPRPHSRIGTPHWELWV